MPPVTFTGFRGVITDLPAYRLPEGMLAGLRNGWLRYGQMQRRPGFVRLVPLPSDFVQFGIFHRAQLPTGIFFLLGYYDGTNWKLVKWQPGDTSWSLIGNLPGQPTDAVTYKGWVFIATTGGMRKTNGQSLFNWGIQPPIVPPSPSVGTSGNLTGTYQWRVTYVRKEGTYIVESNPSPASPPLTFNNQRANLSLPLSSDPQVNARRVYRTGGTRTTWDLVAEINDNTTTTYVDNTPDSSLVGAPQLSFYNDPPPTGTIITVHRERIFLAGNPSYPTRVYFSTFGEPEYFPPTTPDDPYGGSWFEVGQQDGQPVMAMAPVGTMLAIFKARSCWLLRGESQADFVLQPFGNIGASNRNSVAPFGGDVFLFDGTNFYLFNGAEFTNLSQTRFQKALLTPTVKHVRSDITNQVVWFVCDDRIHIYDVVLNAYIGYWTAGATFFDIATADPSEGQQAYLLTSAGLLKLDATRSTDWDDSPVRQYITFPEIRVPAEFLKRCYYMSIEGEWTDGNVTIATENASWSVMLPSGIIARAYAPANLMGQRITTTAEVAGTIDVLQLEVVPLRKVVS